MKKGDVPDVLYLYGEDGKRLTSMVERIRDLCLSEAEQSFNYNRFDAGETPVGRIVEEVNTLPVFAKRRVVYVIKVSSWNKGDWEELLSILENPSNKTVLILRGDKLPDSRKAVQAMNDNGMVLECKMRTAATAASWIEQYVRREGKRMTKDAVKLLIERVGMNQGDLEGEIGKILAYTGDKDVIDEEDIFEVTSASRTHRIFDFIDAMAKRDAREALHILHGLFDEGEAPLKVIGMMSRQIRLLWIAKNLIETGRSKSGWPKGFNLPPFLKDKLMTLARSWNEKTLREAHVGLVQIDRTIKAGGISNAAVLIELWVMRMAPGKGPR